MFKFWKNDLMSSIVVFLVALPLCLGIALASNAPLSAGLFAGIIGGIIVGALSDSHVSVSGPAAGLTVIVLNGIISLGSFETFALAVFLAGCLQLIFGLMRAGSIGNYFPTAVIRGMLAAIGLILIIKQFPNALGLSKGWTFESFFSSIHMGIFLISILSLSIILFWEKMSYRGLLFFKLVPGALVAVTSSILLNLIFTTSFPGLALGYDSLVQLPFNGGFSEIFQMIHLPNFGLIFQPDVFQVALTIAIVGSIETLLSLDAAEKIDPEKRPSSKDRELISQGLGNALSGLVGGLPITAVIVRTSANISAGSKTKLSAIIHGVWLLASVALIPGVLNLIPLSCLACVLLLTGYKLCKPAHFLDMRNRGWDQLIVFSSTILAILATDLLKGIFAGIVIALALEIKKIKKTPFKISEENNQSIVEFSQNVTFIHKAKILKVFQNAKLGETVLMKNMNGVKVHVDVLDLVMDKKQELEKKNIRVIIT